MDFATIWYIVLCASVIMYAILDGFDLGVGALHLFFRKDKERRILLNAIGPVWDGNEVWLVIVLGALLAGFTPVYAVLLTGFYTPTMMLIFVIIFRAVAIEFRSKKKEALWRSFWDGVFSFSSIFLAFFLGVGVGNLILGVPLTEEGVFVGSLELFFRPLAVLVGICALCLFTMHGSVYLLMKTEGDLQEKVERFANRSILLFIFVYLITTYIVLEDAPWMLRPFFQNRWLMGLPLLTLMMIALVPYLIKKKHFGYAFITSCMAIASLLALFGIGTYPYLLRCSENPLDGLTIENAASTEATLKILCTIALIGIPLVLAYGYWVYRIFKGKVQLNKQSY